MKPLERYRRMLRNEPVDFVPRIPIVMQFAAEYIGSNYAAFASDHRVLVEANVRCARDFGFDQLSAISDPYRETAGFGAEIVFVEDGPPRCVRPPLEDDRDPARLPRPDPLKSPRMLDRIEALRAYARDYAGECSIMGWVEGPAAEAADLRGVAAFMMDLIDDEIYAGKLMDLCVDAGIEFARAQIEAGADTIGIGDAVCSQLSPDLYERLVLPRQERLLRSIRDAGAVVRLHICGDITHLLEGIRTLPIDILDVDHMVDMARVRRAVGAEVTLAGQIDPVSGIRFGVPDRIREEIRGTRKTVGDPYMVAAGCEIPPGTPYENLRALCDPIAWAN